jgi:hypothetical protein
VNLVGHVAVALPGAEPAPSTEFLVGCMLPDLAAIARVRLSRPTGPLGDGVAFHHASDAAFHESDWFRSRNVELRDALLASGVDHGPARACAHAGVEMVLDGALMADPDVATHARATLVAVDTGADALEPLAAPEARAVWTERLHLIGSSLDPGRYSDPQFVAERLQRMTSGRRRIELRIEQVDTVADTLARFQPGIDADAAAVVASVARAARLGT